MIAPHFLGFKSCGDPGFCEPLWHPVAGSHQRSIAKGPETFLILFDVTITGFVQLFLKQLNGSTVQKCPVETPRTAADDPWSARIASNQQAKATAAMP